MNAIKKTASLFTGLILTVCACLTLALPARADQGVTLTRATPRDVVPIVSQLQPGSGGLLLGTNNVVAAASTNMLSAQGYSWQDVTPGNTELAIQATVWSSATNAGNVILLLAPSIDGITPCTNSPLASATFALGAATTATAPQTSVALVTNNIAARKWCVYGVGNTAAAGNVTITNIYPAFIPLQ